MKANISLIRSDTNLELDHLSLSLLVTTQLKMLASFQWNLFSELAFTALHSQHNLLCSLCFLVMNGSSLTTKTWLFPFVTSLSFGKSSLLCSFVLCHLMKGVFTAFGSFAKRFPCFWNVHHFEGGQWLLSLKEWERTSWEVPPRKNYMCWVYTHAIPSAVERVRSRVREPQAWSGLWS